MRRYMYVLSLALLGLCQATTLAYCPPGIPDLVFCEDFDTYCTDPDGGYPGHTPQCEVSATPDDAKLRNVWLDTSNYEGGTGCGDSAIIVDNTQVLDTPGFYNASSLPFAGRWPGTNTEYLVQTTFRDWVLSTPGNEVLDLHRLIQAKYGSEYDALAGTDDQPLVLSFAMSVDVPGKILTSDGYMELAYGLPTRENQANTDFVWGEVCTTFCVPSIQQGPMPIICAQGNPQAGGYPLPLPAGCPASPTTTAPIHNAIAVGILAMMDTEPCKCCVCGHGSYSDHPVYYDGQVWWRLVSNSPLPSSGTVTPLDGAAMPPPADIHEPGDFLLWHDPRTGVAGTPMVGGPQNWFTLTVKSTSVKIEMTTIETSKSTGEKYQVYNVMDGIPRKYTGPFNTLRGGVDPGCQLASNDSWDTCAPGKTRTCIPPNLDWDPVPGFTKRCVSRGNQASWVDFDDISLAGSPFSAKGACCLPTGECLPDVLRSTCEGEPSFGTFRGENTTCGIDVNNAPICMGACCNKEIACTETRINECAFDWQGYDTSCAATGCPCNSLFADADDDGDVDQFDFAILQSCFEGPGVAADGVCKCFDREPVPYPGSGADNDVDEYDVSKFELCASGPGIPYNPTCDQ